jgi:hypothetical protein
MAGDWMKIELELPDKPEVHAIAGMLNIDPDAVVGKLVRVWQWFDKHTTDGNAFGVTCLLPDRITGVTGFGEAMMFVGWLEQQDNNLVMPKFDRHTSASAKQRALTAKRVAKTRNGSSNDASVTSALAREEKRRDISTSLRSVDKPKSPRKKATQFPEDFTPCETAVSKLTAAGISVSTEVSKFRDHCHSKGKTFIDWQAGFRTWASNAVEWSKPQPKAAKAGNQSAVDRRIDIANQMFGSITGGNNGRVIEHG